MKKVIAACVMMAVVSSEAQVKQPDVYCIILAGGNGERLWPLSRQSKPKQLLAVAGDSTLLDQAIDRVVGIVDQSHIFISTTEQHAAKIQESVGHRVGRVVVEPGSRNTGPAILLSCSVVYKENPNAVIIFLPADPFIPAKDNHAFELFMEHVIDFVRSSDRITLLGVEPTYPATGYGYIEFEKKSASTAPYPVSRFHEKPTHDKAQQYCAADNMLWNIGMFCGKAHVFMEEFKTHARDMYDGLIAYLAGVGRYEDVVSDSVDYAVMEKSKRVSVLPVDFAWCDVGNIEIFLTLKEQHNKALQDNVISIDSKNNLVDVPDQLVALVGIDNLCIVKSGDVLLITKRDESEQVKKVVQALKRKQDINYL